MLGEWAGCPLRLWRLLRLAMCLENSESRGPGAQPCIAVICGRKHVCGHACLGYDLVYDEALIERDFGQASAICPHSFFMRI